MRNLLLFSIWSLIFTPFCLEAESSKSTAGGAVTAVAFHPKYASFPAAPVTQRASLWAPISMGELEARARSRATPPPKLATQRSRTKPNLMEDPHVPPHRQPAALPSK
jgi:hypothetical protein